MLSEITLLQPQVISSHLVLGQSHEVSFYDSAHHLNSPHLTGLSSAGFMAGFSASPSPFTATSSAAEVLKFDNVRYNGGGHYDPLTGVYEVPHDGIYLLNSQVRPIQCRMTGYIS